MTHTMDASSKRLYILLLFGFVAIGVGLTIFGASLPEIIKSFKWSYTVTGIVLSASAVGYFVSTFMSGFLVGRIPPKTIMVGSLAMEAAAMFFFARYPWPVINIVLAFAVGTAQGGVEVVSQLEVIHMEREGQSRLMNLLHAAFSVGAIVGPAAVGALLGLGLSGRSVFPATAVLFVLIATLFAFTPRSARVEGAGERPAVNVLGEPLLLLFTLALLLYVGVEIGVSNWISEYFVKELGAPEAAAALSVSLFWIGISVGRLLISVFYKGGRQELVMLELSLLNAVALGIMVVSRSSAAAAVSVLFAGLGSSGIYPLVMALVGKYFKSGVAVGTAATGGGVGSFTFPFLLAVISQALGLRSGFLFPVLLNVALAALAVAIMKGISRSKRGGSPT